VKKILNPYAEMPGYHCFGCSPKNEHGLQMSFFEEGDEVVSHWQPRGFLQGYHNVLHGGIQATLMDEIGSWLVQVKVKTAGVTSGLSVKYLKTVYINQGNITLKARLKDMRRNLADVEVNLFDASGKLCAKSDITYFTFSKEMAKKKLNFPEEEEFFEEEEG
jgi:uncharacterized protein (TIGR00369 family)